jgi:hypothetical protein
MRPALRAIAKKTIRQAIAIDMQFACAGYGKFALSQEWRRIFMQACP